MKKESVGGILKQLMCALRAITKANTSALKRKTRSLKARLIVFSLLTNKSFLITSISQKLHSLIHTNIHQNHTNPIVLHPNPAPSDSETSILTHHHHEYCKQVADTEEEEEEEVLCEREEKNPDLRHSLTFEDDEEGTASGGSVIEMVKHSKEEAGEEFSLEEDIDHVADLFIRNFHRQMMLQKQHSLERHREMLHRNV